MIETGRQVDETLQAAVALCRADDWDRGLPLLAELAQERSDLPGVALSYLGYGLAAKRRRLRDGRELCRRAATSDFYQPDVLYNLARVEVLAKNRREAVKAVETGLKLDPQHRGLNRIKNDIGIRRPPVLGFLARENPLNVLLGRLRHALRG
jgi:hypothetical protein